MLVLDAFSMVVLVPTPFLALMARKKFFGGYDLGLARPKCKAALEWLAILSESNLSAVCIAASFTIPSELGRYRWGCVARWRAFSTVVLGWAAFFLMLAIFLRKGTRIFLPSWLLTVSFDGLLVHTMA